jgi:hypothetical protein
VRWFGETWGAPVCVPSTHVETPVGACDRCDGPLEGRQGVVLPFSGGEVESFVACHLGCFLDWIGVERVHVLHHGMPICGFASTVPRDWPEGHRWVSILDWEKATCGACRARTPELRVTLLPPAHGMVLPWPKEWGVKKACLWGRESGDDDCPYPACVARYDAKGPGWLPCCIECSAVRA